MGIMEKGKQVPQQAYKSNVTCHMLYKVQNYVSVKTLNFSNIPRLSLARSNDIIYLAFQNNVIVRVPVIP